MSQTASEPASAAAAASRATPDPQSCAARVMEVLPRVMDRIRAGMRRQVDTPLTVPQFRGLNFIDLSPGASISALAAFLGVSLATASALAERMGRAGLVRAQGSTTDRRRTELHILPDGKTLLERMRAQTREELAAALGDRSAPELQAVLEGIQVLDLVFAAPALGLGHRAMTNHLTHHTTPSPPL